MENLIIIEKAVYLFTWCLWIAYLVFGVTCFFSKYALDMKGMKFFATFKKIHKYLFLSIVMIFALYEISPYGALKNEIPQIVTNMAMIVLSFVFVKWVLSANFKRLAGQDVMIFVISVTKESFTYRILAKKRVLCEQTTVNKEFVEKLQPIEGNLLPGRIIKLHEVKGVPQIEVKILNEMYR